MIQLWLPTAPMQWRPMAASCVRGNPAVSTDISPACPDSDILQQPAEGGSEFIEK